jgi:phage gpG-like protein
MAIIYAPTQSPADAAAKFRAMQARAHALGPALVPARDMVAKLIDDSFHRSQSPDGTAYAKNAQSTIDKKGSAKPNIDNAFLRMSTYVNAIPNGLEIGAPMPYAGHVQWGSVTTGTLKHASYSARSRAGTTNAGKRSKRASSRVVSIGPTFKREIDTPWTRAIPARAFLPFTRDGAVMAVGRAKTVFDSITRMVMAYITTGKVTP